MSNILREEEDLRPIHFVVPIAAIFILLVGIFSIIYTILDCYTDAPGFEKDFANLFVSLFISLLSFPTFLLLVNLPFILTKIVESIGSLLFLISSLVSSVLFAFSSALNKSFFAVLSLVLSLFSTSYLSLNKLIKTAQIAGLNLSFFLSRTIIPMMNFLKKKAVFGRKSIHLIVLLKLFFPDEIVAEMKALHEKLSLEKKSSWYIRTKLFYEFITLIWALNVQIKIDNLHLPSKQRNVDD
jgi:hypothetical protein